MDRLNAGQEPNSCGRASARKDEGSGGEGIRGLDARLLLAQARTTASLDPEKAEEMFFEAACLAELQGIEDAKAGVCRPPVMYAGEELYLLQRWRWGFHFELECEELRDCRGCNDGSGDPCPIHG